MGDERAVAVVKGTPLADMIKTTDQMPRPRSVSYTHLDVYKRQVPPCQVAEDYPQPS